MRPRNLLILALVVAALGAFVWFFEREQPGSDERAQRGKLLLPLDEGEVAALTIETGGRRLRLERRDADEGAGDAADGEDEAVEDDLAGLLGEPGDAEEWVLVEPLAAPADAPEVRRFLGELARVEKQRTLDEVDRAGLGLDAPRATLTLETSGGRRVITVGPQVPSSASMIVALDLDDDGGGEAYVVDTAFYDDLIRPVDDWRDRELFPGERADVRRLRLLPGPAGGGPDGEPGEREEAVGDPIGRDPIELVVDGGSFRLERPLVDDADRDRVDRLLADLMTLRVADFLADPPAEPELGLTPPRGAIEVDLAGRDDPFRIELGNDTGEGSTYARVALGGKGDEPAAATAGQPFVLGADFASWLATPVEDWRSLAWSGLEEWRIDAISIAGEEGALRLERSGTDWLRDRVAIPFTPVSDLLAAVSDARGERFAGAGADAFGTDAGAEGEPLVSLTLTGSDGGEERLRLYPARDGLHPARREGRAATLLLPASVLASIEDALAAVRAAEPLPPDELEETGDIEVTAEEGDG